MAKKSRRARRGSQTSARAQALPRSLQGQPKVEVNFAEEYAYVLADLKRIGLIALAMLLILITLAFVVA